MDGFIDGYRHTGCRNDEIITALIVPKPRGPARSHFLKLGARRYLVISIVMAAGVIETDAAGTIAAARVAVGSCSAVPQRLPALETVLIGQPLEAAADIAAPGASRSPRPHRRHPRLGRVSPACGAGAGSRSAGAAGQRLTAEGGLMQDTPLARATATVSFTLNGRPTTVSAAPFASLADTLREELGLTGTKIGCEAGDCGACTVRLDGEQVCACLVATAQVDGARIDTVEGANPRHRAAAHAPSSPAARRSAASARPEC